MTAAVAGEAPPSLVDLSPLGSMINCASSLREGHWQTAGLDGLAAAVDVTGAVVDPVGTLATWATQWALEHLGYLNTLLDQVAGDAQEARGRALQMMEVATQLRREGGGRQPPSWVGLAAASHGRYAANLCAETTAAADAAAAASDALMTMASIVEGTRTFIRALLAEVIAWAVKSVAAAGLTAGVATPVLAAGLAQQVSSAVGRAAPLVRAVNATARALDTQLSALTRAVSDLTRTIVARTRGYRTPPARRGPSTAERAARGFHAGPEGTINAAAGSAAASGAAEDQRQAREHGM